jgi:hypothetical protein
MMKLTACPTLSFFPTRTRRGALAGFVHAAAARLRNAWHWMLLDRETRYLCEAEDLADLERRMRVLERGW